MEARVKRPGYWRRPWVWVLAGLFVLVVVVAVGLQPFVQHKTRQGLDRLKAYRADFSEAHLSLIPLEYGVTHLKIERRNEPAGTPPLFYVERLRVRIEGKMLLRGKLATKVMWDGPKLSLVKEDKREPTRHAVDLADNLKKALPLELDRLEVKHGQLLYVFKTEDHAPTIWIHDVGMTLENLATRANLEEGTTTLAFSGTLQRSGELSAFVTADPLEKQLTFSGHVMVKGLEVSELNTFLVAKTDMKAPEGTLDLFARFEARDGRITGGVKPVLKNARLESASPNLFEKLKAALADAGLKLFSDRVPGRNAVATVIPIRGDISRPELDLWPTILGVVRNAFVEGLTESFHNVPAPSARRPQPPLEQARRALSPKGGVPLTQPPRSRGDDKGKQGEAP